MSKVCEYVKGNYTHITNVKYFFDGCTGQYKNLKNFLNLCHHYSDFNLEAEWNFFATNHGKFAVNGIGGIIKRLTARASFQRPYNNQILSSEAVYQFCSKTTENILFNLIERDTFNLLWIIYLVNMNMEKLLLVRAATTNYTQYQLMRLVLNK